MKFKKIIALAAIMLSLFSCGKTTISDESNSSYSDSISIRPLIVGSASDISDTIKISNETFINYESEEVTSKLSDHKFSYSRELIEAGYVVQEDDYESLKEQLTSFCIIATCEKLKLEMLRYDDNIQARIDQGFQIGDVVVGKLDAYYDDFYGVYYVVWLGLGRYTFINTDLLNQA